MRIWQIFIFWGVHKNVWAETTCHVHIRVHSLGTLYTGVYRNMNNIC